MLIATHSLFVKEKQYHVKALKLCVSGEIEQACSKKNLDVSLFPPSLNFLADLDRSLSAG